MAAIGAVVAALITGYVAMKGQKALHQRRMEAYDEFQASLNQFRRALTAPDPDFELAELMDANQGVHDMIYKVWTVAPKKVTELVIQISHTCGAISHHVQRGRLDSLAKREEAWRTRVWPLRRQLNNATAQRGGY
ncbi:hypothetical protein OHS70_21450 [Streptomyces sp. NBC_00390]|uniref:hypothetical protein n=1 Tax=Streptomyces sp. NBC_00390 TaxID=2975736 RepID=UPI002E202C59